MFIQKETIRDFKKEFPSVYALYLPIRGERVTVLYLGEENEGIKIKINNFLKEKVSPSIQTNVIFSEEEIIARETRPMFYT